jgi:hypothetical protein
VACVDPLAVRLQLVGVKVPEAPPLVKETVPVGFVGDALVSVTVAVHVVEMPTVMVAGTQLTLVVVVCPTMMV